MPRQVLKSQPIGGYVYAVTQPGGYDTKTIYKYFLKLLLPSMGALGGEAVASKNLADMALDLAAKELAGNIDHIDPMVEIFIRSTDVFGGSFGESGADLARNFDDHFAGRPLAMTEWLGFCLKVSLSDFFDGKASVLDALAKLARIGGASPSPSPSTSTGTSGVSLSDA